MQGDLGGQVDAAILFGALLIALVILVNAKSIGDALLIMDLPDANRKRHSQATPLVGGLAIMLAAVFWAGTSLLWQRGLDTRLVEVVLLCGGLATLVGYADDQSSTSPSSRLLSLLLLSAVAMVIDPDLIPAKLNWISFDVTEVPKYVAMVLVAVGMAGFVNAVNMADGQNGIVTGMFAIWAACLLIVTNGTTANIALLMFETAVVTFLFNMAGRVFLGDAGSYGVSYVFGILAVAAHNYGRVSAETIIVWFFIPVIDCLRLILMRSLRGKAPSDGDRNHFHHRLQDRIGKTAGLCTYLGVVAASSLLVSLVPHLALACMVLLAAFYFSFAWLTEVDVRADEEVDEELHDGAARPTRIESGNVVVFEGKDAATGRD